MWTIDVFTETGLSCLMFHVSSKQCVEGTFLYVPCKQCKLSIWALSALRANNDNNINSYSSRTRQIWADIYNQRGRVGYYQLISGKSEKNNCFSKFSSSPITGNCHSKFFPTSSNRDIYFTDDTAKKFFRTFKISAQKFAIRFSLFGQT